MASFYGEIYRAYRQLRVDINVTPDQRGHKYRVDWNIVGDGDYSAGGNRYPASYWVYAWYDLWIEGQHVASSSAGDQSYQYRSVYGRSLASGSIDVYGDHSSIKCEFRDAVYAWPWGSWHTHYVDCPRLDLAAPSVSLTYKSSTTNSVTFSIWSDSYIKYRFNGNYGEQPAGSTVDKTLYGNPGENLTASLTGIYRDYNWVYTNDKTVSGRVNSTVSAPDWSNVRVTGGPGRLYFKSIPTTVGGVNLGIKDIEVKYNQKYVSIKDNRTLSVGYHETVKSAIRYTVSGYINNQIQNLYVESPTYTWTSKYNPPKFTVKGENRTGTDMAATIFKDKTAKGTDPVCSYQIDWKDVSNNSKTKSEFYKDSSGAGYVSNFSGKAARVYLVSVTATDTDGQTVTSPDIRLICGAKSAPVFTIEGFSPNCDRISIIDMPVQLYSDATIKYYVGPVTGSQKLVGTSSATVDQTKISYNILNLEPYTTYKVTIEITDKNGNVTTQTANVMTYPLPPDISELYIVGKPKAKSCKFHWTPVEGAAYAKNPYYRISIGSTEDSTYKNNYEAVNLTPETDYTFTLRLDNPNYNYSEDQLKVYTLKFKTDADSWLYLCKNGENVFHRYKIYLINEQFPEGAEIKKNAFRRIS